jgi:hypothetical protein
LFTTRLTSSSCVTSTGALSLLSNTPVLPLPKLHYDKILTLTFHHQPAFQHTLVQHQPSNPLLTLLTITDANLQAVRVGDVSFFFLPKMLRHHAGFVRRFSSLARGDDVIYNSTHWELRASLKKFIDAEINPHVDSWEAAGIFPAHEVGSVQLNCDILSGFVISLRCILSFLRCSRSLGTQGFWVYQNRRSLVAAAWITHTPSQLPRN